MAVAACGKMTPRETGRTGGGKWCLLLDGLTPGYAVTGQISSSSVILTLTVEPRDPWLPWPALAVLAGLILAVVVLMMPERLGRITARLRLWDDLARTPAIAGLNRDWVQSLIKDRRLRSVDPAFAAVIEHVIEVGPRRLSADRRRLALAIADCPLPRDKRLLVGAAQQARPDARALREDFFTDDGTVRVQTPLQEWLMRIRRAETILAAIDRLQDKLGEIRDAPKRTKFEEKLKGLIGQVADAGPEASVADAELDIAEDRVSKASGEIRDAIAEPAHELEQLP
ncbi:MAG TPA: hypothetical protein VHN16_16905 [Streptosporangiaceae bacterium]|nr:hypothetical protein [Streptosporangiaceae bacterium]